MKKIALLTGSILTLIIIFVGSLVIINKKDKIIKEQEAQLFEMVEEINSLDGEKKSLESELNELKAKLEKEKSTKNTTSRSSYQNRTSTSNNDSSWSDLELLARIINAEAGGCTDEHQLLVGNVVMNRVASSKFPNSIYGVIYQKGQYSPTWNGSINKTPTEQAYKNAQRLLDGERFCPENVIFQANFKQGSGVYKEISTGYSITYFCY